jgi:hypothetical protein
MMLKLATKFAPQATAFDMAHQAGFRYAELWLDADVLARWEEVVALARRFPLQYGLHFPNRLHQASPTLEHAVQLYRALGCRCMVIHQPLFDRFHEGLVRLDPTLRLAVENHKLTPEGFDQWAEQSSALTLDVEHLWKFTLRDAPLADLLDVLHRFLTRFGPKLHHVHMPGYYPGLREHRPMYCARDMIFPVLSLLAEFQFEGLIVSEINPEFQNPNDLRMDVLLFDSWQSRHLQSAPGNSAKAS